MATVYFRALSPAASPREAAYRLLHQVLGVQKNALCYGPSGKPGVPGGPEFSLSHTKGAVVLAVDPDPVGVDVEALRPISPKLPRRVLSGQEFAWFSARGSRPADFFTLWTLKESYYKALGTGLPGIPNKTAFFQKDGIWQLPEAPFRFFTWEKDLLRIALCSHAQQVEFVELTGS